MTSCLPTSGLCDDMPQCGVGDLFIDEQFCDGKANNVCSTHSLRHFEMMLTDGCPIGYLSCGFGTPACVPNLAACNGTTECVSGVDEFSVICGDREF